MSDTLNSTPDPLPPVAAIPAVPVTVADVAAPVAAQEVTQLEEVATAKEQRPVTIIAAFGIIAVALTAVGTLAYDVIINKSSQSLAQLGTFGTLGLGGLLALSGTKPRD